MKHSASQAHQIEKEVDIIEERREMRRRKFEGEGNLFECKDAAK